MITFSLAMVGALNWGLVGLFRFNLVETVVGPMLSKFVYILVGLSAGYVLVGHKDDCKVCGK